MKAKEFLVFTKRERSGIISLIILILVVVIVPVCFDRKDLVTEKIAVTEFQDTTKNKRDTSKNQDANRHKKFVPPRYVKKKIEPFEINIADTSAFIALPGIGSKLAARIILFREKLGGFYNVEQIREVYGLRDSVFQKILPFLKCDPSIVRKININTAEKESLKVHPYIRWNIANALLSYREQHGQFNSPDDLAKLENVDVEALEKMMPYISFK